MKMVCCVDRDGILAFVAVSETIAPGAIKQTKNKHRGWRVGGLEGWWVVLTGFVEDLSGLLLNTLPAALQLVLGVLQLHHPDLAVLDGLLQLLVQVLSHKQTDKKQFIFCWAVHANYISI